MARARREVYAMSFLTSCAGLSAKRVFALYAPRIHLLRKNLFEEDGLPGQARQ